MFTGLVETTGLVEALKLSSTGTRVTVQAPTIAANATLGESVSVNGCCLTVATRTDATVTFDLLAETLARTNLGELRPGSIVNLERALSVAARLGGHFVQGHIDCTTEVLGFDPVGGDFRLELKLPKDFAQYVVFKGSIAVDGISLTVAEVREQSIVLWIIPHTRSETNLKARRTGESVNLEFDLLAKYVERLLAVRSV